MRRVDLKPREEELELELPDFDKGADVNALGDREVAILSPPDFQTYPAPIPLPSPDLSIQMPAMTPYSSVKKVENDPLDLPSIPHFTPFAQAKQSPSAKPQMLIPQFSPAAQPQPSPSPSAKLQPPHFSDYQPPLPIASPPQGIENPQFSSFIPPKKRLGKHPKAPEVQVEVNPVMKQFKRLVKFYSYDDILKEALRFDSMGDMRMLKNRSLLRDKHVCCLLEFLERETPWLLPKSDHFQIYLENDQDQLNLFANFCHHLMAARELKDINFQPHTLIDRLLCTEFPISPYEIARKEKILLQIKDWVYCFFCEILEEEKRGSRQFNALKKDLKPLSEALRDLAAHIHSSAEDLRMKLIRDAAKTAFAPWEDRTPSKVETVKLDPGDVPEGFDLEKGLKDIQSKQVKAFQLSDFTHAVLALPENNAAEALIKGKYFYQLAKVYFKLNTISSLNRAIGWIDQAIETIARHVDSTNQFYLKFYEYRGVIRQQMAKLVSPISAVEDTLARKQVDLASRDFFHAELVAAPRKTNFVKIAQEAKQRRELGQSIAKLDEAIHLDDDFAEARFVHFLKHYENSKFDASHLLHPHFSALKGSSIDDVLMDFRKLLLQKTPCLKGRSPNVFKVTLQSGKLLLRFTDEGLALNRSGEEALIELLSSGVKHVKAVYSPKDKPYFAPPLSAKTLHEKISLLGDYSKRLGEMEKEIQNFRSFELASLYKSSFRLDKEELSTKAVRSGLSFDIVFGLMELKLTAAKGYQHLGKTAPSPECYATALLYICQALEDCELLKSHPFHQEEMAAKKMELLLQRASIYKALKLWNCYAESLEEIIRDGKKGHHHFLNPSLHYALGLAYMELNRFEEAEDQFYIVQSAERTRPATETLKQKHQEKKRKITQAFLSAKKGRCLAKKAGVRLAEIELLKKGKKNRPTSEAEDARAAAEFQHNNIREECLQILRANAKVNAPGEPNRKVAIWDEFAKRIKHATTIKELCEVVFASVLPSEHPDQRLLFLKLAKMANIQIHDLSDLDQIKSYMIDAIKTYQAEEADQVDKAIECADKAIAARKQADAFAAFKKKLIKKFKSGELIRPGSANRLKLSDLAAHIALHSEDGASVLDMLGKIIGKNKIPGDLKIDKQDIKEIKEVLDDALELSLPPGEVQGNVLQITGRNIFLSQIKSTIEQTLSATKGIQDVHIVGVNIYVDSSIKLKGMNLALGGEYLEFIKDEAGKPLHIDLSGKGGALGAVVPTERARDAQNHQENGSDGANGNDGEGGQPGGDFCVRSEKVVGLDPAIIQEINLSGGDGGAGSDGQPGGNGIDGVNGANASRDGLTYINDGGSEHSYYAAFHDRVELRRGGPAQPGTEGGYGGEGGQGGKGGESGRLLIENGAEAIQAQLKEGPGNDGGDGQPARGGKGGAGAADGLDYLWIGFNQRMKTEQRPGYRIRFIGGHDRVMANYVDSISYEEMRTQTKGRDRSNAQGRGANKTIRSRNVQQKNNLKRVAFNKSLSRHLHAEGSASRKYAFDEVTNKQAGAHETEKIAAEQLAVKQKKMKDIETLLKATTTLLSQTQTQQQAEAQHSRVATFTKKAKKVNEAKEILQFLKNEAADMENKLPFRQYSPVIHDKVVKIHPVEYALHQVNMTKARHMPSIAKLITQLALFPKEPSNKLIKKLGEIIQNASLKNLSFGFKELLKACEGLQDMDSLVQIIKERKPAVEAFLKCVEEERQGVPKAYEKRIQQLRILKSILRFIATDRLLLQLLTKDMGDAERTKRASWFKQRVDQRVYEVFKIVERREPSADELLHYVRFADETIKRVKEHFEGKVPTFKKIGEYLAIEREKFQLEQRTICENRDWILAHLPEMVEAKIHPMQKLELGTAMEDLYRVCSQAWVNSPFFEPDDEPDSENIELPPVLPSVSRQEYEKIDKPQWDAAKRARLENHVKQLVDLKLDQDYINHLKELYDEPEEYQGLADLFVLHAQTYQSLSEWKELLPKLKADQVLQLKDQFSAAPPKEQEERIYQKIRLFLHGRHVALIKKECLGLGDQFNKFIEKVCAIYPTRLVLSNPLTDLLGIAKQCRSQDPFGEFLKKVVEDQVGDVDLSQTDHLIEKFKESLTSKQLDKAGAYLFLLLNLDISYDKMTDLLKAVSDLPEMKSGHALLCQKVISQKERFEGEWDRVLVQAKIYDQIRYQVEPANTVSIERLLNHIAAEANLLTSDEKRDILNQLVFILSKQGCFTCLPELKLLQAKLVQKLGVFSDKLGELQEYNTALIEAFKSEDHPKDPLPALFLKGINRLSGESLPQILIAIHHLPWKPDQMLLLYQKLKGLKTENEEIKKHCIAHIQKWLVFNLHSRFQNRLAELNKTNEKLAESQIEYVKKIGNVIQSTSLLNPHHQIAKFQLWIKLLDHHYQTQTHSDVDGSKRLKAYKDAHDCFIEKMRMQDTEKGMGEFNKWLATEFNQLKGEAVNLDWLDGLETVQGAAPDAALKKLNSFYWRAEATYPEVLERLQGKTLSEEVQRRLKLKFDNAMLHEELYEVKTEIENKVLEHEKALGGWLRHISIVIRSGEELEGIFPDEELLRKAIDEGKIPVYGPPPQKPAPQMELSPEEKRIQAESYLKDLEEKIEESDEEDEIILKRLKTEFDSAGDKIQERILALELALIEVKDKRAKQKEEKIEAFFKSQPDDRSGVFKEQKAKDRDRLKAVFSSCSFLLGDGFFHQVLDQIMQTGEIYSIPSLAQVFWVLPRLNNPEIIFDVMENKMPENWAQCLLEVHCYEALIPSIEKLALEMPPINLDGKVDSSKQKEIDAILEANKKKQETCLSSIKSSVQKILSSNLRASDKEVLLRLISERLEMLAQGKLGISLEEFSSLLSNFMAEDKLLHKLAAELLKKHSRIANALFLPSFQSFRYALTLAWMEAQLEPEILTLKRSDRQKIYDSLFEIESNKKEEMMRRVVESLRGPLMTPAVAECVSHFADKSFELDEISLQLLKTRTASGQWYDEIIKHTKKTRSEPRTLEKLVSIMAKESSGINKDVKDLIEGQDPKLVKIVKDIHSQFDAGIKDWTKEQITQWAKQKKSKTFLEDPERLKEGIAVVCRAVQLTEGHVLRDTQIMGLWLMLRKSEGIPKGRISQMFTGEGKSYAFAGLAILKAMTESYVDVITANHVLAERDAKNNASIFALFDMTVSNNCDFECEMSEDKRKERYYRNGRPVDIVYGDVGSFERDLLLTEFHGGQIIHPSRMGENRAALVDEVDGLLLDNASMVLYLSHNVDTLRFLERIFGQIWALANHPAFQNSNPFDDRAVEEISKIIKAKIESDEIALPNYAVENARYIEMKSVIYRKLPTWIRSAFYAKSLIVNDEYIIADQVINGLKKKTVTVMDKATGVEQFSLKWSNGLHQFLQFKHGLELSQDSLKAVFLSNFFFFKRYGQNLYGLSGTLGSDIEQRYLQDLYQVELSKIPRFKGEKYIQYKETIAGDTEEWIKSIRASVEKQVKENKRAALLICDSKVEVELLQSRLKKEYPNLKTYTSSLEELPFLATDNPTPIGPGDLIIATNLAGRGTDLKTSTLLEENGGLHVIMTYLPPNIRIEEQGFGRTARSGNEGSGEFIIFDPHRRVLSELYRLRNIEEKQRLENIALKEVKKIEFEQELLRGILYRGEKIEGFQALLEEIKDALKYEETFYRDAQIASLKNRWAFWLDHMEEKIAIVHAIGKETILDSYKEFVRGVREDFSKGGFRLVKEPIELIKLGGEYRRKEMWSEAENCYTEAAKDPHYRYVLYYKAACALLKAPSASVQAKEEFKQDSKRAAATIKSEIAQLQNTLHYVVPIAEQTQINGRAADYGNPYKARTEEKMQVWSIFLSAIDNALGGPLTEDSIKKSQYGENAAKILSDLGPRYRASATVSKKVNFEDNKATYKNEKLGIEKELPIPKVLQPVFQRLKGRAGITKQVLKEECAQTIYTREAAAKELGLTCPKTSLFKFKVIPSNFKGWPDGMADHVKFVLENIVDELHLDDFASHEEMKAKLRDKKQANRLLTKENIDTDAIFKSLLDGKLIAEDFQIDLKGKIVIDPPRTFEGNKEFKLEDLKQGFTAAYSTLNPFLQSALLNACRQREVKDNHVTWSLKSTLALSELLLPETIDEAVNLLWNQLDQQEVTKVPKVRLNKAIGKFNEQLEGIKNTIENTFKGHEEADKAVTSIFEIIESSVGMIYKLEDKKATAKFADIIRRYYYDNQQHAPEGIGFFIELGLEVIADLIEKKDPPSWLEILVVVVIAVVQMVAGIIIKAYLPVVGELIGNALINSGTDDLMFAVNSAATGEFSWSDYGEHKKNSLKNSLISSAISCGVSFGVDAAKMGSVGKAWDVQKLSGIQKAALAGNVASGSFNLGNHILKEMGRNFINLGISQVASRGLEGMTRMIAGFYEKDLKKNIEDSVNQRWNVVMEQASALHKKLGKDVNAHAKIKGCVETLIRSSQEGNAFDAAIRGSRQVMPQARNMIKDSGWGTFLSFIPDIANLGVSIPKLINLIDDNVKQLSRDIRATADRNAAVEQADSQMSEAEFNRKMDELKASYIEQLNKLFNGVLNSAVYAPLVAAGTKALVQAGSDIISTTKQEAVAQSAETLADILEAQENPEEAFYDKALRNWRHANEEVVELSNEDLKKSPENCPESIETLKREYGQLLHIYKDRDGNLYAQRPTRTEYAQAILEGKASGDPEIAGLAKISGKKIALVSPEGKIKLYSHHDGKVEIETPDKLDRTAADTLFLKFEPNPTTGIGHVTLEGAVGAAPSFFEGDDCLYKAVQQGAHLNGSVQDLRQETAATMNQEGFKRFYHDWSLSSEPKQFVGAAPYSFQSAMRTAAGTGMVLLGGTVLIAEPFLVGATGGAYTPILPLQTELGTSLIAGGLVLMAPPVDISFTTSSPITEITKDFTLVFNKPEVQDKTPPRTEPADLIEKLMKDEVLGEGPSRPQDEIMKGKIKDPKYPPAEWKKVEITRIRPDGSKVTTHHMEHRVTHKKEQFKFKNKPPGEK